MTASQLCKRCGAKLLETTTRDLCPSCLLQEGLAGVLEPRAEEDKERPEAGGQRSEISRANSSPAPTQPPPPADFGDYELLEQIGRGGMGVVYKARQKSLERMVALKMLLPGPQTSPEFVKRFRAEAVLAASLQHPNIVAIHDIGVHQDQHYFAMDYVAGTSLAQLVGHEPLPAQRAARYLKTIAEAIHYAHERGILHRDLKPSNVLVDLQDQPRVTDFGLAKHLDDSQLSTLNSQLTLTGQVLGSPSYIPPEQALGKTGKISRQTDVYALGAMLYHLVTGRPPFQGKATTETLQQVLNTEPAPPRSLNPAIPRDLETICLKCLEKEPPRRYPTAEALAQELGRFLEGKPIQARPVGVAGRAWKGCRRRPALAGMGAALALTFALGLAGVLWQAHRVRHVTSREMRVFGFGNCFYSNGLFYAVGDFRVPTKSIMNSYVLGGGNTTWTLSPGLTLEWRAGLVRMDDNATNVAILLVGWPGQLYAFHKGSSFACILKQCSGGGGTSVLSCEKAALRNSDVILALAFTRAQSNVVITARVLDKRDPRLVLYQKTVVDTPAVDPTLTTAQFQALTGIRFGDLVPDRRGLSAGPVGMAMGLFQYTDGNQPVPTAVFDKLEVRTNPAPVNLKAPARSQTPRSVVDPG